MREHPTELINLYDFEAAARERLSTLAYGYYASGAMDELTLHDNHAAYDRLRLRYRVLRDVSRPELSVTLLGQPLSMPVLVAPTAFQKMAHPEGESATARAAAAAGTVMVLSTISTTSMEEVTEAARDVGREVGATATGLDPNDSRVPVWFQLYVYRDRGVTKALVQRAEAAGCQAIVLTVDAPVLGRRERDVRNRFQLPEGFQAENLLPVGMAEISHPESESALAAYVTALFDPSLSWKDLEWLCGITELPVLVKGVVHPQDARLAAEHGATGVVVSNHGGRQLDTAPATIEALPEVVEAVADFRGDGSGEADGFVVLVDGGIRRGTDVVKALALGADGVAVGRPILWGLAVAGEKGVSQVLEILRDELTLAMRLSGCASVAELHRAGQDLVRKDGR